MSGGKWRRPAWRPLLPLGGAGAPWCALGRGAEWGAGGPGPGEGSKPGAEHPSSSATVGERRVGGSGGPWCGSAQPARHPPASLRPGAPLLPLGGARRAGPGRALRRDLPVGAAGGALSRPCPGGACPEPRPRRDLAESGLAGPCRCSPARRGSAACAALPGRAPGAAPREEPVSRGPRVPPSRVCACGAPGRAGRVEKQQGVL